MEGLGKEGAAKATEGDAGEGRQGQEGSHREGGGKEEAWSRHSQTVADIEGRSLLHDDC